MSSDSFSFKVDQGPSKGRSFKVDTQALLIGSGQSADIVIEGPGVEPLHAQIVFDGGQVMLEDLSNEHGTFRNGQRLLATIQVFPGDRIGLGPEVVIILEGDDPRGFETAQDQDLDELPGAVEGPTV